MANDPIWYFARGDVEKGPITTAQIKALAASGKLRRDDLVWKDGMPDWKEAGDIPGLFSAEPPVVSDSQIQRGDTKAKTEEAASARSEPNPTQPKSTQPKTTQSNPVSPAARQAPAESQAATESPIQPPEQWEAPAVAPDPAPAVAHVSAPTNTHQGSPPATTFAPEWVRQFGYPALLLGLCVVVGAKGCDSISHRNIGRLQVRAELARNRFNDRYEKQLSDLQDQQQEIMNSSDASNRQKEIDTIRRKEQDLREEQRTERRALEQGSWLELSRDARDAQASHRSWAVWRECLFVMGTLVLCVGLLAVGLHGQGAERWICLIMIAIITFSLYVGGVAWVEGLLPGG